MAEAAVALAASAAEARAAEEPAEAGKVIGASGHLVIGTSENYAGFACVRLEPAVLLTMQSHVILRY